MRQSEEMRLKRQKGVNPGGPCELSEVFGFYFCISWQLVNFNEISMIQFIFLKDFSNYSVEFIIRGIGVEERRDQSEIY